MQAAYTLEFMSAYRLVTSLCRYEPLLDDSYEIHARLKNKEETGHETDFRSPGTFVFAFKALWLSLVSSMACLFQVPGMFYGAG